MANKQRVRALYVAYNMALSTNLDGQIKNPWAMTMFVEDIKKEAKKLHERN